MLAKNKPVKIHDQYTDRSGAEFVKIANRLSDKRLASLAMDTLFNLNREEHGFTKTASFSTDSKTDTFLSRIYFEGQREKIAADQAEQIDARLSKYEELYELNNYAKFKSISKTASLPKHVVELLPNCKIASISEFFQSGKDFSRDYRNLNPEDRREFSTNFVKVASCLPDDINYEIPDDIKIYSEYEVEVNPRLIENIELRKVAMERQGKGTGGYEVLLDINPETLSPYNLHKLAEALEYADEQHQLLENKYKDIPDAWHSVFQVKKAEEEKDKEKVLPENLTKADIIGRYGEGILDEVEDDDGEIDHQRLKEIVTLIDDNADKTDNTPEDYK